MATRLLIVDDERAIVRSFESLFKGEGFVVRTAMDLAGARRELTTHPPDVMVADIQLTDGRGLELLGSPVVRDHQIPVVLITSYPSVESATEALRLGASDYLGKPVRFVDLHQSVCRALKRRAKPAPSEDPASGLLERELVGDSELMQQLRDWVRRVAPHQATVLIGGESGTGKEVIARQIHAASPRGTESFVAVNCGAIPATLLESELFGYRRGAFTGAERDRTGLIEMAHGGTLFLDEIGDLPLELQPKILRVLEQQEVLPLGASRPVSIDVRFVAATNRALKDMCRGGEFRQDLYYRLSSFEITAPPLRDHAEDIPQLCEHLMARLTAELETSVQDISPTALLTLEQRAWPGNVRELENTLRRAMVLADGCILQRSDVEVESEDLVVAENAPLRESVRQFERRVIEESIRLHQGDKRAAAASLNISLASLYAKLKVEDSTTNPTGSAAEA